MQARITLCWFFGALVFTWSARTTAAGAESADWPRFRGPGVDGISPEKGLLQSWPQQGPPLLWKLEGLGTGYSTIAISGERLLTMGDREADSHEGQFVLCFRLTDRQLLWATRVGEPHSDGPRCTPTVDGERTYAISTDGNLVCLETASGKLVWKKNFRDDFGGRMMSVWKFSESPLVDGDRLLCTPGGPDAAIVALNKRNGAVIWKCALPEMGQLGRDGAGYSSMVAADIQGVRQYIQILGRGAVGVAADDGRLLWSYNRIANSVANIPTPIVRDNCVFVTTSYKTGSALLRLTRQGKRMKVDEVWFHGPETFENHHGGVVLVGDHLYGGDGQNNGTPVCLEFLTGKVAWKGKAPGRRSAAVLYADGHLIFRYENGVVALIAATPDRFLVKGQFEQAVGEGPAWPHPVVHDGKLYLRSHNTLMCYDIRRGDAS